MIDTKKQLRSTSRHTQIVNGADIVLKENGVQQFTIDKVVDYLGIAKGTFYKYFESKDDVLAEVSIKALSLMLNYFKLSQREDQVGIENTKAFILSSYAFSLDYPAYFELIIYMERPEFKSEVDGYKKISDKVTGFVIDHLKNQQEKGIIRKDIDPVYGTFVLWGSSMGVMQFMEAKKVFIEDVKHLSQNEMMKTYVDMIINGVT
ncbi:TetR/AcrR family transcriptional regulator [Zunongwangia endophytica]|uniref:TetR/AcrR family transcriptional regulator n=1 Tax=Zunongwangia endophytica TaxID=1808945 RepID=A0ABV8H546_9FLAO|nr:TetR/AcrR family transcriptional regulator [Zunongwangia endophytica]MDN3594412.1 TetR/AcrR family transcriptional regulator [Zunongwangia endophytica]